MHTWLKLQLLMTGLAALVTCTVAPRNTDQSPPDGTSYCRKNVDRVSVKVRPWRPTFWVKRGEKEKKRVK